MWRAMKIYCLYCNGILCQWQSAYSLVSSQSVILNRFIDERKQKFGSVWFSIDANGMHSIKNDISFQCINQFRVIDELKCEIWNQKKKPMPIEKKAFFSIQSTDSRYLLKCHLKNKTLSLFISNLLINYLIKRFAFALHPIEIDIWTRQLNRTKLKLKAFHYWIRISQFSNRLYHPLQQQQS